MKKKSVKILMAMFMCFSTAACTATGAGNAENGAGGLLNVDKNLLSVEITIPSSLIGENVTQEELNKKTGDGIKSITLNQDGSATYVVTKTKHKEWVQETKKVVDESIEELVNEGSFPSVSKIEPSSDYRTFTVHTIAETKDQLGLSTMIALGLYMDGIMYNAVNGTPADNIKVVFKNPKGEVIAEGNSKDMGS